MNIQEVCHKWAHKLGNTGKSGNVFFIGNTIYSYGSHFPIATHIDGCVLLTSKRYSVSTASHINQVRKAIPSSWQVFEVPEILETSPSTHKQNAKAMLEDISSLLGTIERSIRYKEGYKKKALEAIDSYRDYCKQFHVKPVKLDDLSTIHENFKKAAAREKSRASKLLKASQKKIEQENQEQLQDWLNGTYGVAFPGAIGKVYLRMHGDSTVQTSRSVHVPLKDAKVAYRLFRRCVETNLSWKRNGEICPVGAFQIDSIDVVNKVITAGCHVITFEEIIRFAKTQEWEI